MQVVISKSGNGNSVESIIKGHKVRLSSKFAFLFSKEVIGKVKTNLFAKPSNRFGKDYLDGKLEEEANTSTGSGETNDLLLTNDQIKGTITSGSDNQSVTTKFLMENLLNFEEFLGFVGIASLDSIREIRKFTRFLIANSLKMQKEFSNLTRESIFLATILLAAEKFELDMGKILIYILEKAQNKRMDKLSKVRTCRSYFLLNLLVEKFNSTPSSP